MHCTQKLGPHDTTFTLFVMGRNSLLKEDMLLVDPFWSQLIENNKDCLYTIPLGRQPGIGSLRWVMSFYWSLWQRWPWHQAWALLSQNSGLLWRHSSHQERWVAALNLWVLKFPLTLELTTKLATFKAKLLLLLQHDLKFKNCIFFALYISCFVWVLFGAVQTEF